MLIRMNLCSLSPNLYFLVLQFFMPYFVIQLVT